MRVAVLIACLASGLAGCVESLPTSALPTKEAAAPKLLTKEEQMAAIGDLTRTKEAERQEALKQIQKK